MPYTNRTSFNFFYILLTTWWVSEVESRLLGMAIINCILIFLLFTCHWN